MLLPLLPLVIIPSFDYPYISSKVFIFRILCCIIFVPVVVLCVRNYSFKALKSASPLIVFMGIIFVADWNGIVPRHSFWGDIQRFNGFVELVYLSFMYVAMRNVMNRERWARFIKISLIVATIIALDIIISSFIWNEIKISTLGNSLYAANYLLINLFLCLFAMNERKKGLFMYPTLLFFAAILITASRGALVGIFCGILCLFLLKKQYKIAVITFMAMIAVGTIVMFFHERGFGISEPRIILWKIAIENIAKKPWLGWGQDSFFWIYNMYNIESEAFITRLPDKPHNVLLDWPLSAGVLGFLSYVNMYKTIVYKLFYRNHVLLAGFVAYMVQNFFLFDTLISYIYFFSLMAFVSRESR